MLTGLRPIILTRRWWLDRRIHSFFIVSVPASATNNGRYACETTLETGMQPPPTALLLEWGKGGRWKHLNMVASDTHTHKACLAHAIAHRYGLPKLYIKGGHRSRQVSGLADPTTHLYTATSSLFASLLAASKPHPQHHLSKPPRNTVTFLVVMAQAPISIPVDQEKCCTCKMNNITGAGTCEWCSSN